MANGVKTYQIKINGLQESISAVESLNNQLSQLDKQIKAVENKVVNVSSKSSGGGSKSSSTSSLSEEEKLEKQIAQIEEKRVAYGKQIYQDYLAQKDLLKEQVNDQKTIAASERQMANSYSNTIQGMKQELADIKTVMQTVDLGDTGQFDKLVQRANELNNKLKEIEQSYGQFGRNVGNYSSAFNGLDKVKVTIGDTVREFNNAREASRTLNNELKTMAANGQQDTKAYRELRQAVMELDSAIADAKKPMDDLMDAMEGVMAIASMGQGIRALFGVDDSEIQKSIQRLVALQNVLQGIETINKQIQTREGVGKWIAPFTVQIDKATAKLLVFNRALLGTGKAAGVAAKGIKLMSGAMKLIAGAGIMIAIDLLIEGITKIVEGFNKVDEAAERQKEVQKDLAEAYGDAQGKLLKYKTVVDNFNGSKSQEKKLVDELNKEFGNTLGTYKSLSEWQDVLKKKGDAYIQTLINQAKAQAALNEVTAAYMNLEKTKQAIANGDYKSWLSTEAQDREKEAYAIEKANERIVKAEENLKNIVTSNEQYDKEHKLGDYAPQIEKNGRKSADAAKKVQEDITKKEIDAMRDGLNKKLRQLDEEERQTINKLKENGRKNASEIVRIQNTYAQLRKREIDDYLKKLEDGIRKAADNIKNIQFDINIKDLDNQLDELANKLDKLAEKVPDKRTLLSRLDFRELLGKYSVEEYNMAVAHNAFKGTGIDGEYRAYYDNLDKFISKQNAEIKKKFNDLIGEDEKKAYEYAEKLFEEKYASLLDIARDYNKNIVLTGEKSAKKNTEILNDSFKERLEATDLYYELAIKKAKEYMEQQKQLNEKRIREQGEKDFEAERQRYTNQYNDLNKQYTDTVDTIDKFKPKNEGEVKQLEALKKKRDVIYSQMEKALAQHGEKIGQINDDINNKIAKSNLDADKNMSSVFEKYLDEQLSNFSDFQSKLNDELSRQPILNSWGIVNLPQTKKQFKELENATKTTMAAIEKEKEKLDKLFAAGLITQAAKNATLQQLNDLSEAIKKLFAEIEAKAKQNIPKFIESCQVYVQGALDAFNQIMDAAFDAWNNALDKEQEQLNKENEMLQEKLDEQEEIIEEHKNNVDSIEDELATARGDRRQHLIDQLNAEISAQRAAEAEKKRIQKEQEANEKKQDALEKKRKKLQYKQQILQAIVNGAMSVTYAAMNSWPVPAIPLMAAAGAATAAQIAIMSANKPYAKGGQLDGGVAVGNRHRDGGIKVLGGRAEIEGGEFITNRISTQMNTPLLEFINSKKKKIDASDLIDFYSSGKVKKNIQSISHKTKYADGGYLPPTLSTNIDINDRLIDSFERYSNRPVVVSVLDITNKQNDIKRVQTLAGLSD